MSNIDDETLDESIYIKKICKDLFREIHEAMCRNNMQLALRVKISQQYIKYITEHSEEKDKNLVDILGKLGADTNEYFKIFLNSGKIIADSVN